MPARADPQENPPPIKPPRRPSALAKGPLKPVPPAPELDDAPAPAPAPVAEVKKKKKKKGNWLDRAVFGEDEDEAGDEDEDDEGDELDELLGEDEDEEDDEA